MLYYGLISLCAVMFSTQFFFTQMFQKSYGSDVRAALIQSAGSALVGVFTFAVISGFSFGYTPFSFVMAILSALTNQISALCTLKAFEKIPREITKRVTVINQTGRFRIYFQTGFLSCLHSRQHVQDSPAAQRHLHSGAHRLGSRHSLQWGPPCLPSPRSAPRCVSALQPVAG